MTIAWLEPWNALSPGAQKEWANSNVIPKAGANILVDLFNAVEAASYGYPTDEGARIRQAATTLDKLIGQCVAWEWG